MIGQRGTNALLFSRKGSVTYGKYKECKRIRVSHCGSNALIVYQQGANAHKINQRGANALLFNRKGSQTLMASMGNVNIFGSVNGVQTHSRSVKRLQMHS